MSHELTPQSVLSPDIVVLRIRRWPRLFHANLELFEQIEIVGVELVEGEEAGSVAVQLLKTRDDVALSCVIVPSTCYTSSCLSKYDSLLPGRTTRSRVVTIQDLHIA